MLTMTIIQYFQLKQRHRQKSALLF